MSDGAVWALFVIVLINTVFIAGIAAALLLLNQKLAQLTDRAHPLIDKANEVLGKAETMTAQASERVNIVLDQTGRLIDDVSRKVETTTSIAEETIAQPLISAASVMAGLSRGWDTYKAQMAKEKGDIPP
jgi:uncharacterized protein YoxC